MEENKDKRSDTSDDIDLALSFRRESVPMPVHKNSVPPRQTIQNGVKPSQVPPIRPGAQNASAPQRAPQPQQMPAKRPLHNLQGTSVQNQAQPQKLAVQKQPLESNSVQKLSHQITPIHRTTTPMGAHQNPAQKSQAPAKQNSVQAPVQNISPQNRASAALGGHSPSQIKPLTPQKRPVPIQPTSAAQPQTAKRGENDDFEIDEITYTQKRRSKHESAAADSATSAVMSVVKAVVYIVVVIAVSVGLSIFVIDTTNDIFKFVVDDKIVSVTVPEYATIDDIADALYDAGAIKHKWAFKLWSNLKTKGKTVEFAAGTYELSTSLNYDYLRMAFRKNTGAHVEVRVTIPEGYTIDEIIELFVDEKGIGTREGFVDAIQNYEFDYPFLKDLNPSPDRIYRLEGYLFPDTYNFYQDSSEVTVIKKLLDNFNNKFVEAYYARCDELGLTVDEAIILASMIEKETRFADELGYVSSVFHNRLKYSASYPYLNSDATIMYAMQHDLGGRPDSMTGEDTEYKTPYNTYENKGLPPGPIANPGLNSIKYALYPNDTKYFYFVSDSNGRTLFAQTEPEHLANINKVRGN